MRRFADESKTDVMDIPDLDEEPEERIEVKGMFHWHVVKVFLEQATENYAVVLSDFDEPFSRHVTPSLPFNHQQLRKHLVLSHGAFHRFGSWMQVPRH